VLHDTAIALMRRALTIVETETPELADAHMQVPLDYYGDERMAAKEKLLFETQPLALIASSEIAKPHDYLVRDAVGRSVLLTRDEDGVAHAFLNYCRHRGAEPAKGSHLMACHARVRTDETGKIKAFTTPSGFGPSDIQSAYKIPTGGGAGFVSTCFLKGRRIGQEVNAVWRVARVRLATAYCVE